MDRVIRVGVIGCGLIAQSIHLRLLQDMPEFSLTAICDVDERVLEAVGERFGVQHRYERYEDLCRRAPIDAVLIATPHHLRPATCAIEAGKHVLIEKPLCTDPAAGRELVSLARRRRTAAMVGYMKRYDAGFLEALARIGELPRIRMSRIHDFAGRFGRTAHLFGPVAARPSPPIGEDPTPVESALRRLSPSTRSLHERLVKFACHDVNLAQGAFGLPEDVSNVCLLGDLTVLFVLGYRGSGPCVVELSLATSYEWFDESFVVFGDRSQVAVRFADPFIPFGRSEAIVTRGTPEGGVEEVRRVGTFADAFRREWQHFASCVREGRRPLTDLESSLGDVEVLAEVARQLDARPPHGGTGPGPETAPGEAPGRQETRGCPCGSS
ncbi:MAG TPA: Gfo/Idh/MocA family oxidoreductase [Candidatus Dormibacteraeota bacterium]|nr:Gfo/Idh/MocA family oxidoreductase [Candidatus Dormibacteraeota bacterium]